MVEDAVKKMEVGSSEPLSKVGPGSGQPDLSKRSVNGNEQKKLQSHKYNSINPHAPTLMSQDQIQAFKLDLLMIKAALIQSNMLDDS